MPSSLPSFDSCFTISDLLAVLKIQPDNAEALAEIASLRPPEVESLHQPSQSSQSSSSSKPIPEASNSCLNGSNGRAFKTKSKPVPFPKAPWDEKKLKIILLPMNIDVPVHTPAPDPEPPTPLSRTPAHIFRKEKQKLKQENVKMRSEQFMYPNWERYAVRKGAS